MSALELIKKVVGAVDRVDYVSYNFKDVLFLYGAPPINVSGLHYVFARHNFPQRKMIMDLRAKGFAASNRNKSGIIEFGILEGSISTAAIEVIQLTGIPAPINVIDRSSNGLSTVTCKSAVQVGTPEWRREKLPGISVYTFETAELYIARGPRELA